jgi:hypothetical protein
MVFGIEIGKVVALICIVISIIFAVVTLRPPTLYGRDCWPSSLFFGGALGHRGEVKGLGRQ